MKNLNKKLFGIIISLTLISSTIIPAYASNEFEPTLRCQVTLESENGTKYLVDAYKLPTTRSADDEDSSSITFVYSLDKDNMTLLTRAMSIDEWDDSEGVNGYITIDFDSRKEDGITEYLLENVSGGWRVDDGSISLSDRFVAYTCQDIQDLYQTDWKEPTKNTFDYDTNFTDYAYEVNAGVLGACSSVNLNRGSSSTWQLIVECNYFDNNILDIVGGLLPEK